MQTGRFSRTKTETFEEYLTRMDKERLKIVSERDYLAFFELCNSLYAYTPTDDPIEIELYEKGLLEKKLQRGLTIEEQIPSQEPRQTRQTPQENEYYISQPSEKRYVPRHHEIRGALSKLHPTDRNGREISPSEIKEWNLKKCYAVYFELIGLKKLD